MSQVKNTAKPPLAGPVFKTKLHRKTELMQLEGVPLKTEPSCTDTEHRRGTGIVHFKQDRNSCLKSIICFFQGGGEMDLVVTWSLVIHMPFYCCLGHASPDSIYDIIILWPQEKETGVTNSTLSFQTLGLDEDHYPKVRVSPGEDSHQIGIPLLQSHGPKEDFSRLYLWALWFHEPHQGTFKNYTWSTSSLQTC